MDKLKCIYTDKRTGDFIFDIFLTESELSQACAYGHELANRKGIPVMLTIMPRPMVYDFSPDVKPQSPKRNGEPPKMHESPSVIECLQRGD